MNANDDTPSSRENVSDGQHYERQARERLLRGYLEQVGDRFTGLAHDVREGDVAPEDVVDRLDELKAEAEVAKELVGDE